MLSFKGWKILLSIPIKLLSVLLKYPFSGGVNKKFQYDLLNSLKLILYRTALHMPVRESALLSIMSNHFILNILIKTLYPTLTKLPNYGKKYDKQSYWLVKSRDRKPSDPILIFLHGGGYFFETMPCQIESLLSIYHVLDAPKKSNLSILVLDYKLASRGYKIPYQLTQLIETYINLVNDGNTNMMLMGDSAGGNLALTFLQHLRLDHVNLPYPTSTILISPWVKLAPDAIQNTPGYSYYDNTPVDMIQVDFFRDVEKQNAILGDIEHTELTISPGNCLYRHEDWEDIPSLVEPGHSVFVIVGEHECFRDDVLEWCHFALKSPLISQRDDSKGIFNPKIHEYIRNTDNFAYVEVVVEPWGVHDSVLYFENTIISKVKKNPKLKVNSLNSHEYFGFIKLANFLNNVLPGSSQPKSV
ncbi:esterase/lipase, putative [Candida dubliniensis CD36]|uniref:Esterase/lipase, putative n=1 Tax=Candida dubliniensis (strain CD36 / ATCC MYA-646 / CBS 7987 / NCPF 3949 / NRRL Y-17841) TaxID=573826 RepID=B9WHS3_CANDC|nr:esterase/lipase, putative [Candida dubliniensis CD36]CAX41717.1 esterase/lipase, putative [Candida dubliniensis CD36]